ncbi:MAG TPA: hypothetical protein VNW97_11595 [Candidatus Saccharimonadales bacterium]|jgi:hypothetical protein|nr:hypothetical protein [Candidatus Saccharimonadales bacterium]
MKKSIICTFILAACALVSAQQAANSKPNATDRIGDDDGGLVQIVPADFTAATGADSVKATAVLKSVQQVSIFLGRAWAEQKVRSREVALSDLSSHPHMATLRQNNIGLQPAAPDVEDFTDFSKTTVNDLAIQHKLVEMLQSKALPAPDASTVFVIFLAPGIKSTIGAHTSGTHFAAYHNLVHVEAGELRYVVVPFNENADRQAAAASLAIVETVFNPISN